MARSPSSFTEISRRPTERLDTDHQIAAISPRIHTITPAARMIEPFSGFFFVFTFAFQANFLPICYLSMHHFYLTKFVKMAGSRSGSATPAFFAASWHFNRYAIFLPRTRIV